MTCHKSVSENTVKRMLHASKTLCGIIILVMNMYIAIIYSLSDCRRKKIVVNKRFCGLAGKFHHHSRRRIRIHIGILSGNVIALCLNYLKEHISCLGASGYRSLVAIGDITLGNLLARRIHQFKLHSILYLLYSHLFAACHSDDIRYAGN